jgi:hypothetical protein
VKWKFRKVLEWIWDLEFKGLSLEEIGLLGIILGLWLSAVRKV